MVSDFPVVIIDKEFHKDIIAHIDLMKTAGTISPDDPKLFFFTDDIDEAVTYIQNNTILKYNLTPVQEKIRSFKWLFEK